MVKYVIFCLGSICVLFEIKVFIFFGNVVFGG